MDNHALGDGGGAGGLQLRHLLDTDQAHAAGALWRKAGIVAEGGNLDAGGTAGVNEQGARGRGYLFAVDGQIYVSHELSFVRVRRPPARLMIVTRVPPDWP